MATSLQIKESLASIKIMMIEDDRIMVTLMRDILVIMGFRSIIMYHEAKAAFEDIKHNDYDLILCDWKMQGMDGIEFTKLLRAYDKGNKRYTPIIMVTGKAHEQDVIEARDAGVTEYLVKPFSVVSMSQKIKMLLENPKSFVNSGAYKGPDRRHRDDPSKIPAGEDRRGDGE